MMAVGPKDFLTLWRDPSGATAVSLEQWDGIVRTARGAKMLGSLEARLRAAGVWHQIPGPVADLLVGARYESEFLERMVFSTAERIADVLAPMQVPVVLLKGAAYLLQGLPLADGRKVSDVDILLPAEALDEAERRLVAAGWEAPDLDPYDDRYYRAWSHELPPLRYPDQPLELDVHHQILPPTGRIHPDADALLAASVAIPGMALRVLCPEDQLLHAAAHTFQDSDCVNRLRDVADVDALIRTHGAVHRFFEGVMTRAQLHGMERPLAYAVIQSRRFFATPMSPAFVAWAEASIHSLAGVMMNRLFEHVLTPVDPDHAPGTGARMARFALLVRYHALRMPPALLLQHSISKALRRWRDERHARSTAVEGVTA